MRDPRSVLLALVTGGFIAGYTIVDALGARSAGSAHAYAAWMMVGQGIPIAAVAFWVRRDRLVPQIHIIWKRAAIAGLMSLAAYWAVIWAMTAAPIALVAALRETSIIIVVVFGVLFLKERLSLVRLAAASATLMGTVLLRFSRS